MEKNSDEEANRSSPSNASPTRPPLAQGYGQLRVQSSNSLIGEDLLSPSPELNYDDTDTDTDTDAAAPEPVISAPLAAIAVPDNSENSSAKGIGKPPRAPHGPDTKAHHTAQTSIGDASFLSALTAVSDSAEAELPTSKFLARPRTVQKRSVSFDRVLETGPPPANVPPLIDAPPILRPLPVSRNVSTASGLWDRIHLADIVSPLESEAETAIFKAVEAHRRQQLPATDILLPNVPNDTVHSFEQQNLSMWNFKTNESFDDEKKENNSLSSSVVGGSFSTGTPNIPTITSGAAAPLTPTRSKPSTGSTGKIPTSLPAAVAEQNNLENTLFGLTEAMRDIHTTSANEPTIVIDTSESARRRLASADIGLASAGWQQEAPIHDQDAFVHNANLLFRRHMNTQENEPLISISENNTPPVTTTTYNNNNKSTWNLFGGDAEDAKKTDREQDADDMEIDIEGGESTASTKIASGQSKPKRVGFFGKAFRRISKRPSDGTNETVIHTPEVIKRATFKMNEGVESFKSFYEPRTHDMKVYAKIFIVYVLSPTLTISALLFYGFGNPKASFGCETKQECPSISWFLNFLFVRQALTYTLAKMTGIFLIDFLALKTRFILAMFGPVPTLLFVQSKGWPFQLAFWAIFSLILNSGSNNFAKHWLFYQKSIDMFNESNPTGSITSGPLNRMILWNFLLLGVAVAVKRFLIGLYLGQRTYSIYGNQLAKVIHQMIVIGQVSLLGRDLEMRTTHPTVAESLNLRHQKGHSQFDWSWRGFEGTGLGDDDDKTEGDGSTHSAPILRSTGRSFDQEKKNVEDTIFVEKQDPFTDSSGRIKMLELLEAWEEPDLEPGKPQNISISAILQFRQSLAFMDLSYPFSAAFGLADTRAHCVESSQGVYRRLMHHNPKNVSGVLEFDAIASLAKIGDESKGEEVDAAKMKDLIRLFRPDRQGNLTMLDFVKSVDAVYKALRLLRAAINSSSQIDRATEFILNCFFYFTMFCVILARLQIDPLQFFLSMSSVILAFAFMIGSASSKYFEGLLFILIRRPYDIGDRISISDPANETSENGSSTWYVDNVDLYSTTVRFGATNEVASLANGALSTCRIINAARSPRALVYLSLKFGVDVPYAKVQLFRKTVEEFVKARPREWLALSGFRAVKVETDLGYIAYVISCQHREAWQNIVPILQSKADLFSYCLEVQKQLGMRYSAPSLPVDLQIAQRINPSTSTSSREGSAEPRARANTTTALEGIEALSDLFAIRRED